MNDSEARLAAAENERHQLITAENAQHVSNIQSELRRYEAALAHIERVFVLRTGQGEEVAVTWIGGSFGVDLTGMRHAIANGATTLTFTAPEGWHFEDDRRLHPDSPHDESATACPACETAWTGLRDTECNRVCANCGARVPGDTRP